MKHLYHSENDYEYIKNFQTNERKYDFMKKRFFAILTALVLILSIVTTASAAQGVNTNSGSGSITVTNAKKDKVYDIYRIFDLTAVDTNGDKKFDSYSYTVNENWKSFFFGENAPGASYLIEKTAENANTYKDYNQLTDKNKTYFINVTDSNVANLAQDALKYAVKLANSDGSKKATADGNLKFENIALGYYLVYPKGAADIAANYSSICSLTNTSPDAQLVQKAGYPDIDKVADKEDVEVGETVTFTVTGKVPDTTGYSTYTYELTDTMSDGLTFNSEIADMTVKLGDTAITVPDSNVTLKYENNGYVLSFDMTKYQAYKGKTVTVTYKAVVNDAAVCEITENKVRLKYSNSPDGGYDYTPYIEKQVYTSKIVVDKFDGKTNEKLSDAKFVLVKKDGNKESYYKYTAATPTSDAIVSWYTLAEDEKLEDAIAGEKITEVITDGDGAADFKGIKDGTYYLRETESPKGYNMLANDVECKVVHTTDETVQKPVGVSLTKEVANVTGTILPGTGGMGTAIFYIIGGLLVAGAIAFLITKRKSGQNEQ